MKRVIFSLLMLLLFASIGQAQVPQFGVGAYGGLNMPLIQDDQGNGTAFGIRARLKLIPVIMFEPNVMFGKWGDPDPIDGLDLGISGSKITSFGVDAILGGGSGGLGFSPFGVIGAGIIKIKNDDTGYDESKLGFNAGFGFNLGIAPMFEIDVRGIAFIAPQENGSKKALLVTAGINYYFGVGM